MPLFSVIQYILAKIYFCTQKVNIKVVFVTNEKKLGKYVNFSEFDMKLMQGFLFL
jgi:ribosomal protein L7Ae-like RNA K-turn-binding protein